MKRAILVTTGTVAGLAAALAYTPRPAVADLAVAPEGLAPLTADDASAPLAGAAVAAAPGKAAVAKKKTATAPAKKAAAAKKAATPAAAAPAAPAPATTPAPTPSPSSPAAPAKPTPTATPKPAATPTPRPTTVAKPKPTPTPTPTTASGDFTGTVVRAGVYGTLQVQVRVSNGTVTDIAIPVFPKIDPRSQELSASALPQLRQEALAAQSAQIASVTGASFTSQAFISSLQAALTKAGI